MAESNAEKTQQPTAKRLRDAKEKGQLLRSRDFGAALVILVGCAWVAMLGPSLWAALKAVLAAGLQFGRADIEDFQPFRPLVIAGGDLLPSMAALGALSVVTAVLSGAGLGAWSFNPALAAPKANRINPASGLARIFGPQGWIELGKSILKAALLGTIGAWMLWSIRTPTIGLARSDLPAATGALGDMLVTVLFAMAGGMVLIAMVDVPVQWLRHNSKLKMSLQEVKDEHKESEGSPENKAAIRSRQVQMAKRSMKKAVGEAHVVLTNPTHFSVALRYERGRDQVPVVVAKGRGITALAIRELAGESKLPILEYPALARAVYYTSREGQEVRDDLYLAIATVLAWVFRLNHEAGGSPPPVEVPIGARFDENGVPEAQKAKARQRTAEPVGSGR